MGGAPERIFGCGCFFCVVGYVVSAAINRRKSMPVSAFLLDFYARRVRRIIPALLVCVVLTAQLGVFFIQYPGPSLEAGRYALFGLSNFHFYLHSTDYFGEAARHNLFTHTWSLGVEEQFYLIFPMVFLAMHLPFFRQKVSSNVAMLGALVLLGGASLAMWVTMGASQPAFSYFMLPTRFWELALGCLTFYALNGRNLNPILSKTFSIVSVLVLFVVPFLPKAYLGVSTIAICLATAGLIATIDHSSILLRTFSARPVVAIGLLSYSLYLWHWPVIAISRYTVGLSAYTLPFQLLAVLLLGSASYRLVERPFRHGAARLHKGLVIFTGFFSVGLSMVFLGSLNVLPNKNFSANLPRFDITRASFPLHIPFKECSSIEDFKDGVFPPKCAYINSASANSLWFVGDSTTWALKGLASETSRATGKNIVMFARDSAFPSVDLRTYNEAIGQRREDDRRFFREIFSYLERHAKAGDVLVLGGNIKDVFCITPELFCRHGDGSGMTWRLKDGTPVGVEKALVAFLQESNSLAHRLRAKGVHVVLNAPLPRWTRDHRIFCEVQWYRPKWENSRCDSPSYAEQEVSRKRLIALLKANQEPGGYRLYDPFGFLCTPALCRFSDPFENTNWWADETHLTTAGGVRLAGHFMSFLKVNGLSD